MSRSYLPIGHPPRENGAVLEVTLDGTAIGSREEFYAAFFEATAGVVPDYGGRNLDALVDDLREVEQPLTITWVRADASRDALGEWFERVVSALTDDGRHPYVAVDLK